MLPIYRAILVPLAILAFAEEEEKKRRESATKVEEDAKRETETPLTPDNSHPAGYVEAPGVSAEAVKGSDPDKTIEPTAEVAP